MPGYSKYLLTGGLGYIGAHIAVTLVNDSPSTQVIIVDNLSNSKPEKLDAIRRNVGEGADRIIFYNCDINDKDKLDAIFKERTPDVVIHLAGLKAVAKSLELPIEYYKANMASTMTLVETMSANGCRNLIFSSSATVYGPNCPETGLNEEMETGRGLTNPYARTKYFQEEYLKDVCVAEPRAWNITILRYFNPVGAACSELQEDPKEPPNNLFPHLMRAHKSGATLQVYGTDYPTHDGTAMRDFIHVQDLAEGHLAAARGATNGGLHIYNLGTGRGVTVGELIQAFNVINQTTLDVKYVGRRAGDVEICFSDCRRAAAELGWNARRSVYDMMRVGSATKLKGDK
jgi:UDP-glucose 4-epimerase